MSADFTAVNLQAWETRTPVHFESRFYDVPAFLTGRNTLKPLEIELCGDVRSRRLLHLQCHFGLDTLSWTRLGANASGVDFSPGAISAARRLAAEIGSNAQFHVSDVLTLQGRFDGCFDLAVSTYGALCWLSSLDRWAQSVASCLAPGGRLVVVEFHPILDVLFNGCISGGTDYFRTTPNVSATEGTYAARDASINYTEARWIHPVGSVVTALLKAGFRIEHFAEHPFCSYPIVSELDTERDGLWWPPASGRSVPYMFSIVAEAGHAENRRR
ncbi:MAG: class I SAM-dependent methyltransferase [Rhizobacter sp.]